MLIRTGASIDTIDSIPSLPAPLLFVGHRGSGKSALARLASRRWALPCIDIDGAIEEREGSTAAELVARDEHAFRAMEIAALREALATATAATRPAVIAAGAGLRELPAGAVVVWIDREGWDEVALRERARLRPDRSFEEEHAWMVEAREPLYAQAHLRVRIPRGATEDEALELIGMHLRLLLASIGGEGLGNTWLVPARPEQLGRCCADTALFGCAGVEIRSDTFPVIPDCPVPWLASLRTREERFFHRCSAAAAFDCDIEHLGLLDLDGLEPRTLLLSVHPQGTERGDFEHLTAELATLRRRHPDWVPHIALKYAPVVKSWVELRFAYEQCRVALRRGIPVGFFPQGRRWTWMRLFRLRTTNAWNYASPGSVPSGAAPPPLADFFPMAAGPVPDLFCGVIGDPVDQSLGDVWHRAASLRSDGGRIGYMRIPLSADEMDVGLYFLFKIGFHGLSITSPLKQRVIASHFVVSRVGLSAGNTLTFRDGGWVLTDSDERGMDAVLARLAREGIETGPVALLGRGGVTQALLRSLRANGWTDVTQLSAREGWKGAPQRRWRLVLHAGGEASRAYEQSPEADVWIDLRYRSVPPAPPGAARFLNGLGLYYAQAEGQRNEWLKEV